MATVSGESDARMSTTDELRKFVEAKFEQGTNYTIRLEKNEKARWEMACKIRGNPTLSSFIRDSLNCISRLILEESSK